MSADLLHLYVAEMRIANYSPVTIRDRLELLHRLADHLGKPLADATADDLLGFQRLFTHLAPATVNIYSRHVKAFYDWAVKRRHLPVNPADELVIPRIPRGRPHPTLAEDLNRVFACTAPGPLRTAYTLAAFAGLRRGEICQLHRRDLTLDQPVPVALVHGKGRKERVVPLLPPVVAELGYGLRGWVISKDGRPYIPDRLSTESGRHLQGLGVSTTLHSMRHFFATNAARATKDPLFVRDLLGHESVATTEIYMDSVLDGAHDRLADMAAQAERLLGGHGLFAVRESGA